MRAGNERGTPTKQSMLSDFPIDLGGDGAVGLCGRGAGLTVGRFRTDPRPAHEKSRPGRTVPFVGSTTAGRIQLHVLDPKEIKEWSRWSGLNRRPTVYETVALPLSYTGFGDLFQAPRNRTTTQKAPSRHPFFFSPKVLPCKPPLQDPCKESAARAKLSSRKSLTAFTLPRMRARNTRSQNLEASSFVVFAARFSGDTGNGAPADARAFGHRFGATQQDTSEVIPRTTRVDIGDTGAPRLGTGTDTTGPTRFRYLPSARSSRRTASGLRAPSGRPS